MDEENAMIKQFIKFALIGVSNSAVNFTVYNTVLFLLRRMELLAEVDFLIAQVFGFAISVIWSFCMNRRFVFNSEEERAIPWYKALMKMYMAYGVTGIGLNSILSMIWVRVFGIPKEILSLINDGIGLPINFLLNKFWSFRQK